MHLGRYNNLGEYFDPHTASTVFLTFSILPAHKLCNTPRLPRILPGSINPDIILSSSSLPPLTGNDDDRGTGSGESALRLRARLQSATSRRDAARSHPADRAGPTGDDGDRSRSRTRRRGAGRGGRGRRGGMVRGGGGQRGQGRAGRRLGALTGGVGGCRGV